MILEAVCLLGAGLVLLLRIGTCVLFGVTRLRGLVLNGVSLLLVLCAIFGLCIGILSYVVENGLGWPRKRCGSWLLEDQLGGLPVVSLVDSQVISLVLLFQFVL